jgi:sulfatase modifying factor 1
MENLKYIFNTAGTQHQLNLIFVESPGERGFWFGEDTNRFGVRVNDFFMADCPVTQALWKHVMGDSVNQSRFLADENPVEHVSWDDINNPDGFLEKINNSDILKDITAQLPAGVKAKFRLPSETEWEYAARGGTHWRENLLFSGSDNINDVAWYKANSGNRTWPVAQKAPNQLGIYDMCGNIWEWCQDSHTYDTSLIPRDGSPYWGEGKTRILRGGCHHNGAVHCTVSKRYEIIPDAADECIGFRLALGLS